MPLQALFFLTIFFGNIEIIYLPLTSLFCFCLAHYFTSRRVNFLVVVTFFLALMYMLSFQLLPKYLLQKQTRRLTNMKTVSLKYFSNRNNNFKIPGTRPLIIEYWNNGCSNCFKKMEMLEELKVTSKEEFDILCVYADYKEGVKENFPNYISSLQRMGSKYSLDFAYDSVYYHYDQKLGLPQTLIISPKGEVLYSDAGYNKGNKTAILNKYKSIIERN